MTFRYLAGALGIPFLPISSLLGSDLLPPLVAAAAAREGEDPFTGERLMLMRALQPDVEALAQLRHQLGTRLRKWSRTRI